MTDENSAKRWMLDAEGLFTIAQDAAASRRPDIMIEALTKSGYLDGLVRRLIFQWANLPRDEIDECVAKALSSAYETVSQGGKIYHLKAWLWKVSENEARDVWRHHYSSRTGSDENLENISQRHMTLTNEERQKQDRTEQYKRDEAIRFARNLLPRIGEGQIIDVVAMLIDAAANNVPDLSASEIADALGITSNAARTLLGRGLNRLQREARNEGIEIPEEVLEALSAKDNSEDESG